MVCEVQAVEQLGPPVDAARSTGVGLALGAHCQGASRHTQAVNSCAFALDGSTLVTTSDDYTARVWCTRDCAHLHTLTGHTYGVSSCAFAPDGSTLVTTSDDYTARVWCTRDWSHIQTLDCGTAIRTNGRAVFAPNGSTLVTTSHDRTSRVWSDDQM